MAKAKKLIPDNYWLLWLTILTGKRVTIEKKLLGASAILFDGYGAASGILQAHQNRALSADL